MDNIFSYLPCHLRNLTVYLNNSFNYVAERNRLNRQYDEQYIDVEVLLCETRNIINMYLGYLNIYTSNGGRVSINQYGTHGTDHPNNATSAVIRLANTFKVSIEDFSSRVADIAQGLFTLYTANYLCNGSDIFTINWSVSCF